MKKVRNYWTIERCKEVSMLCSTIKEFSVKYPSAYSKSLKNGWLDEVCYHMSRKYKPSGYWNYERCKEEALKYNSRNDFKNGSCSSYSSCLSNGWLDDVCSHMIQKLVPMKYWTYEKCKEEALKYKNKSCFISGSNGAYLSSVNNKWIEDVCSHMPKVGNMYKRCVYVCEFPDGFVYVGLTYDFDKRIKQHIEQNNSSVYKHIKETNSIPIAKMLCEYIDVLESKKMEEYFLNIYIQKGFKILNIRKTGGVGSSLKWTYERCKEEALKYNSRNEFKKGSRGSYGSCLSNGWLDDVCSHMIEKHKPSGYWTYERCKEEILKYKTIKELYSNNQSIQYVIKKNKWEDLYSLLEYSKKPNNYWTYERCKEESLKYSYRKDFQKNCGGAYNVSLKNDWLDDFYNKEWSLYIVECSDEKKSLYTGISNDVDKRIKIHNSGSSKSSKFCKSRLPVKLIFTKKCENHSEAAKLEYDIKQMTRKEKEEFIKRHK